MNQPSFQRLRTPDNVSAFFQKYFPDAAKLLPKIAADLLATPPSSLRTLKCFPYHYGRSVLIGDSAHTMVPFYGQGINCSFEDVSAFFNIFDRHANRNGHRGTISTISEILEEFTRIRTGPGNAIADLSLTNLPELSSRVDDKSYHIRNRLERMLYLCDPNKFMPLYHMVAFTNIPYDELVCRYEQERSVVDDLCHRFDIETEPDQIIEAYASRRGELQ